MSGGHLQGGPMFVKKASGRYLKDNPHFKITLKPEAYGNTK
jgi:hypothetical protein